eukprot:1708812-Pleurochrysis_carterae.AAC.1
MEHSSAPCLPRACAHTYDVAEGVAHHCNEQVEESHEEDDDEADVDGDEDDKVDALPRCLHCNAAQTIERVAREGEPRSEKEGEQVVP